MAEMRKIVKAALLVAILAAVVLVSKFFIFGVFTGFNKIPLEFQKGIAYCSWAAEGYSNPKSTDSLKALKATGTDHIAILVTWYQTNCWSGDIHRLETTPSDESIISAIRKSHELGLKVMLKPHLDIIDQSDGSWRGEIGCVRDPDWDKWFEEYTKFIMHYVDIARKEKVELFCVGTELSTTATIKGYKWIDLIKLIRKKYSGALTFGAHWETYQDIRFWKDLDYIGINAYFPLSEEMRPDKVRLKEGWEKWVKEMEDFQAKIGKPVIFPEVGCNSSDGAAIRPWEHTPRWEINLGLQADYYDVLMEIFSEKKWFYGAYWWFWGTNPDMGGDLNANFTPQNKPAEDIIKKWYAKQLVRPVKF
ncbi:MAG: hypothetical protein HQL30_08980 [Candidatus Omnitrophica bacterium]|nr:hypothetical protein [Candidatus Omnitrophota bacterium]